MEKEAEVISLAKTITQSTESLCRLLTEHGLPMPSLDTTPQSIFSPQASTAEITTAKTKAINACMELLDRLQGPLTCMLPLYNGSALQTISRYKIYTHVPTTGSISYEDLSSKCGIHVFELKQVIRFAIVFHRLFTEEKKGFVAHSAGSRILAQDGIVQAGIGQFDEFYPAFARTVDAIDQFDGHEPNETGFSLAHNTNQDLFSYLRSHPAKSKQFTEAMKFYTGPIPAYSPNFLIKGYPWDTLPTGSVVVDLGGADGHVGQMIADANPGLCVIVQDLDTVVEAKAGPHPVNKRGQVEFLAHDFFTPQPITADVYLFRWVLHDWSDEYVVRILRQLVPALKKGARVVVNESLCPESGSLPLAMERYIRYMDMMMLAFTKSRLRDEEEWRGLFAQADGRFGGVKCWTPEGAALAIIEATWIGN
ncbi:hypothetical protein ASPVEDRAFT_88295 [Aspergillus versicolor CBS 583.65]|uniref:O-methyltransferase C-terminal domain-containing protein n=1 Tax=Aspergillus versicolor CBS 583.65 TaxID=1036611 RepID=A0A1L9PZU5_ASPVE|nr:uncharacterized protein ASPVEDRAFT_88295 [Aspergillus versicolor CBS 583.65]OJJ07029.1 hypothetical protein ASPVEDRAFT_88295 [Aspergillus versicolor CBS 583.65]